MRNRRAGFPAGVDIVGNLFGLEGTAGLSFLEGQAPVGATVRITLLEKSAI